MNFTNVNDIAAIVKKSRKIKGWTQADLAMRSGVSRDWLISLEKGKQTLELALVLRTLRALGVTLQATLPDATSYDHLSRSERQQRILRKAMPAVNYQTILNENGDS